MNRYSRRIAAACIAALFIISSGAVSGQETDKKKTAAAARPSVAAAKDTVTIETLNTLILNRKEITEQIKVMKHERDLARSEEEKTAANAALDQLRIKLADIESDLESIATGVDMESFLSKPREKIDWKEELLTLVTPLLSELKRATDRPRQLERLRGEIQFQTNQLATITGALQNIDALLETKSRGDARLKSAMTEIRKSWVEREQQISDRLKVNQYQLDKLLSQRQSLFESSQEAVKSFFRSRGKNFVFAAMAFLVTFIIMRSAHRLVYRYSPIHKAGERTFFIRVTDVAYHILTAVGATGALLFVLYTMGDWLLLSFAIIFILGIAWTARAGMPIFWRQVQLMLNLGTVRENERIIFNGVPWRVVSLNVYAMLENPALKPCRLRVPLRDLLDLNSRTFDAEEPWFPCNINEWVILSDGTWGQVVSQTPEMVQLAPRGGSRITYQTPDFQGMSPRNISRNFRIKIIFGLDYALQAAITREIPERLEAILKEKMSETGYFPDMIQLKVEMAAAGASSLDLAILGDFAGKLAPYHNILERLITRMIVEACNENGWNIPFPQVTVHTQEPLRLETGASLS
ncbi:hypothetical protein [Desulfococcus sp.]|uniref:hypothetical protein n=1 Tax=Desulfococcus sp. TaxID=2025834 RepID=UPI003593E3DB